MLNYTSTTLGLRLRIGPACEAGLSAGMRRERVPPHRRKMWSNSVLRQTIVVFRYHIHRHCGLIRRRVITAGVLSVGPIRGVTSVAGAER